MNRKNILLLTVSWPLLMYGMDKERTFPTIVADDPGCMVYQEAIKAGNDDEAITLINAGLNINAKFEETDENALTFACRHGRINVAQALFDKGATLNSNSFTLHDVVQYPLIVDLLMKKAGLSPDATSDEVNFATPLRDAILKDNAQTVAILLNGGADPNKPFYYDMWEVSPLVLAEAGGNSEIIALLRKTNAKKFQRNTGKDEDDRWFIKEGARLIPLALLS